MATLIRSELVLFSDSFSSCDQLSIQLNIKPIHRPSACLRLLRSFNQSESSSCSVFSQWEKGFWSGHWHHFVVFFINCEEKFKVFYSYLIYDFQKKNKIYFKFYLLWVVLTVSHHSGVHCASATFIYEGDIILYI